jgi:hypothetical protein
LQGTKVIHKHPFDWVLRRERYDGNTRSPSVTHGLQFRFDEFCQVRWLQVLNFGGEVSYVGRALQVDMKVNRDTSSGKLASLEAISLVAWVGKWLPQNHAFFQALKTASLGDIKNSEIALIDSNSYSETFLQRSL